MEIVAIGGGNKTPAIKEALNRTGEGKPSVLLIPSACSTPASYERKVPGLQDYFRELGTNVAVLHEYGRRPTGIRIEHELGNASLIYTIGGNSPYMFRTMREHGTDIAIENAIKQGRIHAGVSAGALLPFELAHSCVAARPAETDWDYEILAGLGLIRGIATAHANQHDPTPSGIRPDSRLEALAQNFPKSLSRGYAIDNGAAMLFSSTEPAVIFSDSDARVHTLTLQHGELDVRPTEIDDLRI